MQTDYQRELNHSYMQLHVDGPVDEASYELRMIAENRIPGLLPFDLLHINQEVIFRYDITSLQPLSVFLGVGKLDYTELRAFLLSLIAALIGMEDYLLNPEHLMLRPEMCFWKWETKELFLPYCPEYSAELPDALKALMEELLAKIRRDDQETVVLAYRMLHALEDPHLRLMDLRQLLVEPKTEVFGGGTAEASLPPEPQDMPDQALPEPEKPAPHAWLRFFKSRKKKRAAVFSEPLPPAVIAEPSAAPPASARCSPAPPTASAAAVFDGGDDACTVFLRTPSPSAKQKPCAQLIPLAKKPELTALRLDKQDLLVGSQALLVDLLIPVPSVSRIHARIYQKNGQYLLMDLSSKNGTSVDDRMLSGQEEVPLAEGSIVVFADCAFRFTEGSGSYRSHLSQSDAS